MAPKSPPRLIGLCSPCMGSGKTEVANRLVRQAHGQAHVEKWWQAAKFAAHLKVMAQALLENAEVPTRTVLRMLEGDLKETPVATLGMVTPRRILQTLGTEWGREIMGKDFWVNAMMPTVDSLLRQGFSVVIDDMRFANEADAIVERGGLLVRVVRPDAKPYAAHASEGELDGWAMPEIINNGSLADLHAKADALARGELY